MNIGGPQGPGGPSRPKAPAPADNRPVEGKTDQSFAEVLGPTGSGSTAPITSISDPQVAEIANKLRSGALSAEQAAAALVDTVVAKRAATLSPAQQSALRGQLEAALRDDPTLLARLKRASDD
ncbi:MAG: hypothetical protein H6707_07765 [Deltaproteobacteria bacterium]|nr:hypothetical protein [Deltaproteobacteria bacterium]